MFFGTDKLLRLPNFIHLLLTGSGLFFYLSLSFIGAGTEPLSAREVSQRITTAELLTNFEGVEIRPAGPNCHVEKETSEDQSESVFMKKIKT